MLHQLRLAMSLGLRALALQLREHLRAHALDGGGLEPRLVQREPQQVEGLVLVFLQRAQRAADVIAVGMEIELDRLALQHVVEGAVIQLAGAFVEQADRHVAGARLVRGILRRAAA